MDTINKVFLIIIPKHTIVVNGISAAMDGWCTIDVSRYDRPLDIEKKIMAYAVVYLQFLCGKNVSVQMGLI